MPSCPACGCSRLALEGIDFPLRPTAGDWSRLGSRARASSLEGPREEPTRPASRRVHAETRRAPQRRPRACSPRWPPAPLLEGGAARGPGTPRARVQEGSEALGQVGSRSCPRARRPRPAVASEVGASLSHEHARRPDRGQTRPAACEHGSAAQRAASARPREVDARRPSSVGVGTRRPGRAHRGGAGGASGARPARSFQLSALDPGDGQPRAPGVDHSGAFRPVAEQLAHQRESDASGPSRPGPEEERRPRGRARARRTEGRRGPGPRGSGRRQTSEGLGGRSPGAGVPALEGRP